MKVKYISYPPLILYIQLYIYILGLPDRSDPAGFLIPALQTASFVLAGIRTSLVLPFDDFSHYNDGGDANGSRSIYPAAAAAAGRLEIVPGRIGKRIMRQPLLREELGAWGQYTHHGNAGGYRPVLPGISGLSAGPG